MKSRVNSKGKQNKKEEQKKFARVGTNLGQFTLEARVLTTRLQRHKARVFDCSLMQRARLPTSNAYCIRTIADIKILTTPIDFS